MRTLPVNIWSCSRPLPRASRRRWFWPKWAVARPSLSKILQPKPGSQARVAQFKRLAPPKAAPLELSPSARHLAHCAVPPLKSSTTKLSWVGRVGAQSEGQELARKYVQQHKSREDAYRTQPVAQHMSGRIPQGKLNMLPVKRQCGCVTPKSSRRNHKFANVANPNGKSAPLDSALRDLVK